MRSPSVKKRVGHGAFSDLSPADSRALRACFTALETLCNRLEAVSSEVEDVKDRLGSFVDRLDEQGVTHDHDPPHAAHGTSTLVGARVPSCVLGSGLATWERWRRAVCQGREGDQEELEEDGLNLASADPFCVVRRAICGSLSSQTRAGEGDRLH